MIYRHTQKQIQDYYDNPALNQSALKAILKMGVQEFIREKDEAIHEDEKYYEDKEHFLIGKGVDVLITEGREVFDTSYFYSKLQKKPSEKPMAIVKKVFESIEPEKRAIALGVHRWELYEAMNSITDKEGNVGWYMNLKIPSEKTKNGQPDLRQWVEDKRHELLLKDGTCQAYWTELLEAGGKQVLSEEQHAKIWDIYQSLTSHRFTHHLFEDGEDVDVIFQLPLYWEEEVPIIVADDGGVARVEVVRQEMKCMLDEVRIEHKRKTIVELDIKTTRLPITKFAKQVEWRRYDVQGSVYTQGLNKCRGRISELIGRDVSDYHLSNFAFVAESTTSPGCPLIFVLKPETLEVGMIGDGDEKRGWMDALKDYKQMEFYGFDVGKMMDRKKGVVWINKEFEDNITHFL